MARTDQGPKRVPDARAGTSEPVKTDRDLHPEAGSAPLEPDELIKQRAAREALRRKRDDYLVESDLEDEDQRFPLPAMKEQD